MTARPHVITKDIATAGTAVQVIATQPTLVRWALFRARAGNAGKIFVGDVNVSITAGYELNAGESLAIPPLVVEERSAQPIDLFDWWVDASSNGDDVDIFYLAE